MKEIVLSKGKCALVDDEDYEYLNQWKWSLSGPPNSLYAIRAYGPRRKREYIQMHRVIMNTPKHLVVDHIDHNGLNNQKSNLRNCTRQQNQMNMKVIKASSKYRGVYLAPHQSKTSIYAGIRVNGRHKHLGSFKTEVEAAMEYDKVAKQFRGEFAILNFPNPKNYE
jgi:hypothetical protein